MKEFLKTLDLKQTFKFLIGSTLKKWVTALFILALFAYTIFPFSLGYLETGYAHHVEILIIFILYIVIMLAFLKIESYSSKSLPNDGGWGNADKEIPIDTVLKILGIAGGVLLGAYGFFTGMASSEIDMKLECTRFSHDLKDNKSEEVIAVTAHIEKGQASGIQFFEVYAIPERSEDLSSETIIEMIAKIFELKDYKKRYPLITIRRYQGLDGIWDSDRNKMHLNQGDTLTLSTIIDKVAPNSNYIVTVYLIGKTAFSIPKEQWTSSCISMSKDWIKIKNEKVESAKVCEERRLYGLQSPSKECK